MPFDQIVESSAPVLDPIPIGELGGVIPPDIITWPWPRMIPTAYHTFVFLEGTEGSLFIYELTLGSSKSWEGVAVGVVGNVYDTSYVDVVDFGHYYIVISVGHEVTRNFAKLIGNKLIELSSPLFAVGCNNNGQFVGGNISNSAYALGSDGIAWSGIGVYEFNPEVDITSGFKTLVSGKVPGKRVNIRKILPFTSQGALTATGGIIIYTDCGNVILNDSLVGDTFTYSLGELEGTGVASSNHVAGNNHTHGFINLNNEFCKYQRNKELKILGYNRQIEELKSTNTPLILSFLEDRNTFFLSNGVSTLVINDYGAGMIHQATNGVVRGWDEKLYGTFRDFGDIEGRITLEGNSVDSRGIKTLEWTIADINYSPETTCVASSYWRNGASEEWRSHSWKSGSPSGEFFIGLSAIEYRVALRFSNYVGSDIFGLKLHIKFPDARTRRGIAAISGVSTQGGVE